MFEINLIKDQVIPLSKKILRTLILASYFIIIVFITIIILLLSMGEETKIKEKEHSINKMIETIDKTKKERDEFDASLDRGRQINQEIERFKSPWVNRVNFAYLYDYLIKAWENNDLNRYATILSIKYDANYDPKNTDPGKVVIIGWFADDTNAPIQGGYDKVTAFALNTLEKLKTELLNNSKFKLDTNITKIEIDANSSGFGPFTKRIEHISYFKILMETEDSLYPKPIEDTKR